MHRTGTDRKTPRRWSSWISGVVLCWCLLLGLWSDPARAEPARVLILIEGSNDAYAEVTEAIRARLNELARDQVQLLIKNVSQDEETFDALLQPPPELIISIGSRASALAQYNSSTIPILSVLISVRDYALLNQAHAADPSLHSAIYLDQPLSRQLDLLHLILPKTERLASLSGPQSAAQISELSALSAQRGMRLSSESVAPGSNPIHALTQLIDDAEALFALPDPDVFNRTNVQAILMTTYRNNVPVIGFSQAYVRAGALAAVHSTARQIGRQAGEWVAESARTGNWQLGSPRYPSYYSVAINHSVAQSLGISIGNEDAVLKRLQQLENLRP